MFSVEARQRERGPRWTAGVALAGFVVGAAMMAISMPIISYIRLDIEADKPEWVGFCVVDWPLMSNEVMGGRLPESTILSRDELLEEGLEYLRSTRPDMFPEPIRDDLVRLRAQAVDGGFDAPGRGVSEVGMSWVNVVDQYFGDVCAQGRSALI